MSRPGNNVSRIYSCDSIHVQPHRVYVCVYMQVYTDVYETCIDRRLDGTWQRLGVIQFSVLGSRARGSRRSASFTLFTSCLLHFIVTTHWAGPWDSVGSLPVQPIYPFHTPASDKSYVLSIPLCILIIHSPHYRLLLLSVLVLAIYRYIPAPGTREKQGTRRSTRRGVYSKLRNTPHTPWQLCQTVTSPRTLFFTSLPLL